MLYPTRYSNIQSSQSSKVGMEMLFIAVDNVNEDDNDVTVGGIVTVCQPLEQKRALPRLPIAALAAADREGKGPKFDISIWLSV